MIGTPRELEARLALVRAAVARSPEPLHVPLGIVFRPMDGEQHLRVWAEHTDRAVHGGVYAPATLYAHVPFCARVCTYCLLSAVKTPGRDAVAAYVTALRREIGLYARVVGGLRFGSVHVGGGTPTLLDEAQLHGVLGDLCALPRTDGALIGVEAHPGTATRGRLSVLKHHGVHRVSFGVESMTPAVLRAVNREDQTETRVASAVETARSLGLGVNVDLLAGLPGETDASWDETVRRVLALAPDSLSVNRFLGENSLLGRYGWAPDRTETLRVDGMLQRADGLIRALRPPRFPEEALRQPGFGTQYGWDPPEGARRYFQDDMMGPVSTLALGHGALGHVHGRHFSVAGGSLEAYVERLSRGAPPDMLTAAVDPRFEMAFFAADRASRGDLSLRGFQTVFGRDVRVEFARELGFLLGRGLLTAHGDRLAKPPDRTFQVTHLLAFLLRDVRTLAPAVQGLAPTQEAPGAVVTATVPVLHRHDDVDAWLDRHTETDTRSLTVDVGDGLDGETATRLAAAGARRGMAVTVRGEGPRALAQYDTVGSELPLSMLWVRIAIRASQAGRGEQRLAVIRRGVVRTT